MGVTTGKSNLKSTSPHPFDMGMSRRKQGEAPGSFKYLPALIPLKPTLPALPCLHPLVTSRSLPGIFLELWLPGPG